ncbi:hypothetical protein WA026_009749 [Henosepilachna vigintioctopunctata]|uniref:Uncharacterized protein n=1 Tax=Henosepilachna vigintioctopunctata TaxID=420089 RepID=A0AAW1TR26_9CUCU
MIIKSTVNIFIHVNIFIQLSTINFVLSKSQSIWYPVWITKDLGASGDKNMRIGTNTYHIPTSMTDSPVQVDLLPETAKSLPNKFPNKIAFLFLKNHQCLLDIPQKRESGVYKRRFVGIKDGIFPHPYDNNKFVICHKCKGDNIDCLEIDCPKGTTFDSEDRKLKSTMKINKEKRNAILGILP